MRVYTKYMHTSTHVSTRIRAWKKKMHRCVPKNECVDKSTDKNTCVDKCTQRNACTKINARMHKNHTHAHTCTHCFLLAKSQGDSGELFWG